MENIINEMLKRINFKISLAKRYYNGEWDEYHECRMAEIDGMIDMLSIATGKSYVVTENGLEERNQEE